MTLKSKIDFDAAIEHFRELGDQFETAGPGKGDGEKENLYKGLAHLAEALLKVTNEMAADIRAIKDRVDRIQRGT